MGLEGELGWGAHSGLPRSRPVIDWTRTDLEYEWTDGSRALAFDMDAFAAFDLHILERPGAAADYDEGRRARARARFDGLDAAGREALARTVTAGLPGRMVSSYSLETFKQALASYTGVSADALRTNMVTFLKAVVPAAERAGVYLAIHPDDPPVPLLGLPRVLSTAKDVRHLLEAVPSPHNGITFCAGSFASAPGNDVEAMAEEFAGHTHFVHLRNVRKAAADRASFVESDHLDGDVDMFRVVRCFVTESGRRRAAGWRNGVPLPFRPDHGHKMLDDLRGKVTNPGYTAIGRLRGLAEVRGLQEAIVRGCEESGPAAKRPRRLG